MERVVQAVMTLTTSHTHPEVKHVA
jgi:hypothetical protein